MNTTNSIGWPTATALVVANMIGAGIFTSLGFQLTSTTNSWSILILWILGAVMALCGALSYAELGTHWRRSGGEYEFLSRSFHPVLGYLSGWLSLTVGFSAPVALSAMALGAYVGPYLGFRDITLALGVLVLVSIFHSLSLGKSSLLQNITTLLKVALLLVFIFFGLYYGSEATALHWGTGWQQEVLLPAFAVSFVFVTFSYSGWNAAAYIIDEIREVRKNLPRALVMGTLIVSLLYLLLNFVFLKHNPLADIRGTLEIGQITAVSLFGDKGGMLLSLGIGILLISSISAMVWAGPRVTQVMGEDYRVWKWFARKTSRRIPLRSIWLQAAITFVLIISGTFEQVMVYCGFVLQLSAALTVAGVFRIRRAGRDAKAFKSPLFPLPQLLFLTLSAWVLTYLLIARPVETGWGLVNVLAGLLVYAFDKRRRPMEGYGDTNTGPPVEEGNM